MGKSQHFEVLKLKEVNEERPAHGANSKEESNQLNPIVGSLREKELDGDPEDDDCRSNETS
jgi:hypothetical protein